MDDQRKSGLPGGVGGGCDTPIAAVAADRPRRDAGSERVPDHRVEALARLKLTDDRLRQAFGERRKRIPVEHIPTGQGIHDNVGAVAVRAGRERHRLPGRRRLARCRPRRHEHLSHGRDGHAERDPADQVRQPMRAGVQPGVGHADGRGRECEAGSGFQCHASGECGRVGRVPGGERARRGVRAQVPANRDVFQQWPIAAEHLLADEIGEDARGGEREHSAQCGPAAPEKHEDDGDREPEHPAIGGVRESHQTSVDGGMRAAGVDPSARSGIRFAHPPRKDSAAAESEKGVTSAAREHDPD